MTITATHNTWIRKDWMQMTDRSQILGSWLGGNSDAFLPLNLLFKCTFSISMRYPRRPLIHQPMSGNILRDEICDTVRNWANVVLFG